MTPQEEEQVAALRHKCVLCGVVQNSGEELVAHFIGRHNFDVTSLNPIQCDKCALRAFDVKVFAALSD